MAFAFEELNVYRKALDFAVNVIETIDNIDALRKHYRLFEQIESSSTSISSNISEGGVDIQKTNSSNIFT